MDVINGKVLIEFNVDKANRLGNRLGMNGVQTNWDFTKPKQKFKFKRLYSVKINKQWIFNIRFWFDIQGE